MTTVCRYCSQPNTLRVCIRCHRCQLCGLQHAPSKVHPFVNGVVLRAAVALLALSLCAHAADWRKIRRAVTVAYCAASAVDGWQSTTYLDGKHGVTEMNPQLRTTTGVNVTRLVLVKAAMCGGAFVVGEKIPWQRAGTLGVTIMLGEQVFVDARNKRIVSTAK